MPTFDIISYLSTLTDLATLADGDLDLTTLGDLFFFILDKLFALPICILTITIYKKYMYILYIMKTNRNLYYFCGVGIILLIFFL